METVRRPTRTLNETLLLQLERLGDPTLTGEALEEEQRRSRSMAELAQAAIAERRLEFEHAERPEGSSGTEGVAARCQRIESGIRRRPNGTIEAYVDVHGTTRSKVFDGDAPLTEVREWRATERERLGGGRRRRGSGSIRTSNPVQSATNGNPQTEPGSEPGAAPAAGERAEEAPAPAPAMPEVGAPPPAAPESPKRTWVDPEASAKPEGRAIIAEASDHGRATAREARQLVARFEATGTVPEGTSRRTLQLYQRWMEEGKRRYGSELAGLIQRRDLKKDDRRIDKAQRALIEYIVQCTQESPAYGRNMRAWLQLEALAAEVEVAAPSRETLRRALIKGDTQRARGKREARNAERAQAKASTPAPRKTPATPQTRVEQPTPAAGAAEPPKRATPKARSTTPPAARPQARQAAEEEATRSPRRRRAAGVKQARPARKPATAAETPRGEASTPPTRRTHARPGKTAPPPAAKETRPAAEATPAPTAPTAKPQEPIATTTGASVADDKPTKARRAPNPKIRYYPRPDEIEAAQRPNPPAPPKAGEPTPAPAASKPARRFPPEPVMEYESAVDFRANGRNRGLLRPVTVHGRVVERRKAPPAPIRPQREPYSGLDGARLRTVPARQRDHWTEAQWTAFHEYNAAVAQAKAADTPAATAWTIKDEERAPRTE